MEPIFETAWGTSALQIDDAGDLHPTALIEHDALVSRAICVGEHLYAISPGSITVHDLDDPSVQRGELTISDGNQVQLELRNLPSHARHYPIYGATQVGAQLERLMTFERPTTSSGRRRRFFGSHEF